jgi:hypothetical protein
MSTRDGRLEAALEEALLREIGDAYLHTAYVYFRNALSTPQFELVDSRARLGRWVSSTRTIELSRPLVLEQPWGVVLEVLKHEMAHQYVCEVLGETETPHGPRFRSICETLGIDATATGMPTAATEEGGAHGKIIERISKLLALAASPNVNEAEAAMAAAQRLLLKHNIEVVEARTARGFVWKHLGEPSGRTTEADRILSLILSAHFFVDAIWVPVYRPLLGKRASVLEICGTPSNVAIAEYVHSYLLHTGERLWREHKREKGIRENRDRRSFLAGVMNGMRDKLKRESASNASTGLVWVADAELQKYFRQRHPRVRQVRYAGSERSEAYAEGCEAGRRIILHKGVEDSRSRGGPPLQLGSGKHAV